MWHDLLFALNSAPAGQRTTAGDGNKGKTFCPIMEVNRGWARTSWLAGCQSCKSSLKTVPLRFFGLDGDPRKPGNRFAPSASGIRRVPAKGRGGRGRRFEAHRNRK